LHNFLRVRVKNKQANALICEEHIANRFGKERMEHCDMNGELEHAIWFDSKAPSPAAVGEGFGGEGSPLGRKCQVFWAAFN